MACGDLSLENCHYSIHDIVVTISHGGETWLEQSGGEGWGGFDDNSLEKVLRSVPVVFDGGEED